MNPYIVVVPTWPIPELLPDGRCANPAIADDGHAACQAMLTDDEVIAVAKAAWVYPSTIEGLAQAQAQLPSIPWDSLGFMWGYEIP